MTDINSLKKLGINENIAKQLVKGKDGKIKELQSLLERAKLEEDQDAAEALRWALFYLK